MAPAKKTVKKTKKEKPETAAAAKAVAKATVPDEALFPNQGLVGDEMIAEVDTSQDAEGKYYYGLGRRKTSIAQVRLFTKGTDKKIMVNDKDYQIYFTVPRLREELEKPLKIMKVVGKFAVKVKVSGGGIASQAGAVRLGIARALVEFNAEFRKRLRRNGYLTRDSRMVERKKPGLKKARKAPQWAKR